MKIKTNKFQLLILSFIFFPYFLFAQLQQGKNGFLLPVHDTIRVLVVYAEVNYIPGNEPSFSNPSGWPTNSNGKTLPPADADSLFDPIVPNDGILKGWVSGKYQDASLSNYYVLGDYYPEVINVPEFSQTVATVIDSLNNKESLSTTLTTAHGLTLSDFDSYTISGIGSGMIKPHTANYKIDVVLFIWRNNGTGALGGGCTQGNGLVSSSTSPIKDMTGGVESYASYNACGDAKGSVDIILSEYMHGMYGSNNWHTAGGAGVHNFLAMPHSYSITGQSNSAMRFVNGFDRWFLGWKTPAQTFDMSAQDFFGNEVESDWSIQNHPSDSFFVLRNFVTTGDAIRIKFPHIGNSSAFG